MGVPVGDKEDKKGPLCQMEGTLADPLSAQLTTESFLLLLPQGNVPSPVL